MNFTSGMHSVGLSLKGDFLSVQETGFFDLWENVKSGPVVRVFLQNSRIIKSIKPGLALAAQSYGDFFPGRWVMYLGLDQELSSAAMGTPAYNTPKTANSFSGSSSHAWGAVLKTGVVYEGFHLDLDNNWEGTLNRYEAVNIGGRKSSEKAWIVDGFFNLNLAWDKLELNSLIPRIGVGFDWNGTYGQAPGVSETKWRLNLGFKSQEIKP